MLKGLKNNKAASFFMFAALFFELLLNLATPPLEAPDEFNHFNRAYQVSEGNFFPLKHDRRLGGYIPKGILDFHDRYRQSVCVTNYVTNHTEIFNSFKIETNDGEYLFQDFANTAYYSPISYLPQAFILCILRQFHARPAVLYYGGRLFIFVVWLLSMCAVIRILPVLKWLFTALILLPMNSYLMNSFSADTVTNILSFLFISVILKHIFVTMKIQGRHIFILGLLLLLLCLSKLVYIGLVVMLLAIPKQKFTTPYYRLFYLALLFLISGFLSIYWSNTVMQFYIPFRDYNPEHLSRATVSPCGDYYAQKNYILTHGFYILKVIYHSLFDHPYSYLSGYIGVFGNLDIPMPAWLYIISFVILLIIAFTEKNEFQLAPAQKLTMLAGAGVSFVLLLVSQHLLWDCVGAGVVASLQGRYLIPIFPLIFVILNSLLIKINFNPVRIAIPFIILLNLFSCYTIYHRFFVGNAFENKEIYCNAEEVDIDGSFKTSDPGIQFEGGGNRTSAAQHGGSYSALLSPKSPYCFTYKFKGLHMNDLVETEAWVKGEGALIIISGKQKNCGEFYFGHAFKDGNDTKGWNRIKNIYSYSLNCDSAEIGIYIWNPKNTSVFVDDVRISIKKFK